MIFKKIKQNKIYIIIFFICFMIMILSALNETNIFNIVGNFIFNSDYRENFTLAESTIKTDINLFQVIKQVLSNYSWKFDYILIFGTNFFQILLPFIVSIIGVSFYNEYNTIYNFSIHKQKSYSKFIKNNIIKKSLKMSATMFLAFLMFYVFFSCCI